MSTNDLIKYSSIATMFTRMYARRCLNIITHFLMKYQFVCRVSIFDCKPELQSGNIIIPIQGEGNFQSSNIESYDMFVARQIRGKIFDGNNLFRSDSIRKQSKQTNPQTQPNLTKINSYDSAPFCGGHKFQPSEKYFLSLPFLRRQTPTKSGIKLIKLYFHLIISIDIAEKHFPEETNFPNII